MGKSISMMMAVLSAILLLSCGKGHESPKPRGYFRIDLPEKQFLSFDSTYPYTFEYPSVAVLNLTVTPDSEQYWMNIEYPDFKGIIHLSYKPITDNLPALLEDANDFANKHLPKATSLEPIPIIHDSAKVYGLVYDIRGTGVASTLQFYLTDSTSHYLRGALYFYVAPNNDSLAPVIDYVHHDIEHLINTFRWK